MEVECHLSIDRSHGCTLRQKVQNSIANCIWNRKDISNLNTQLDLKGGHHSIGHTYGLVMLWLLPKLYIYINTHTICCLCVRIGLTLNSFFSLQYTPFFFFSIQFHKLLPQLDQFQIKFLFFSLQYIWAIYNNKIIQFTIEPIGLSSIVNGESNRL